MTAVLAILGDSYRELRARRIFWLVLAISAAIVLAFGSIGFNEKGMSIGYGLHTIEEPNLVAGSPLVIPLMDFIFTDFVLGIWLAWGAIILALISTASVFPDFLAGGSVDLVLSKPVNRWTVFLTKYAGSLIFVLIQSMIFCIGIFLVLGLRLSVWRWPIFWAVPVVVLVFSYLYAVMVLMNVLTRSVLASLLVTAGAWMAIFVVHTAHRVVTEQVLQQRSEAGVLRQRIDWFAGRLTELEGKAENLETLGQSDEVVNLRTRIENITQEREREVGELASLELGIAQWEPWQHGLLVAANVLPKPSETTQTVTRLLEQSSALSRLEALSTIFGSGPRRQSSADGEDAPPVSRSRQDMQVEQKVDEYYKERSPALVILSSLLFEAGLICIAGWIFFRTDF